MKGEKERAVFVQWELMPKPGGGGVVATFWKRSF
jgi:hypothetical protein